MRNPFKLSPRMLLPAEALERLTGGANGWKAAAGSDSGAGAQSAVLPPCDSTFTAWSEQQVRASVVDGSLSTGQCTDGWKEPPQSCGLWLVCCAHIAAASNDNYTTDPSKCTHWRLMIISRDADG